MLQMGGVGPMLGQANHFLQFNAGKSDYAEKRYGDEAKRLYGVLDQRLVGWEYLAGDYSIADIATWPWISRWPWHRIDWADYPYLKRWYVAIALTARRAEGLERPVRCGRDPRSVTSFAPSGTGLSRPVVRGSGIRHGRPQGSPLRLIEQFAGLRTCLLRTRMPVVELQPVPRRLLGRHPGRRRRSRRVPATPHRSHTGR